MNNLTPFQFGKQQVRVTVDDQGEPWFVGADVCVALDISNVSDAMSRLDDDEKGIGNYDTPGGRQQMATINESGLYSLILRSRKPSAAKFKKWVTSEVLPSIRKTGGYSVAPATPVVKNTAMQLVIAQAIELDRLEQEQQGLAARLQLVEAKLPQEQDYFTVVGYSRFAGEVVSNNMAVAIGRRAARISRARRIPIGDTTDPRYGFVHTYQVDVLAEVFAEYCETA